MWTLAVHPVIVNVPDTGNELSMGAIVVFAGGVLAALAAVGSAILTARAADRRLIATLKSERERERSRSKAESKKLENQFAHERNLVQRRENRVTIDQAARVVARNCRQVESVGRSLSKGGASMPDGVDALKTNLEELREEAGVVAIQFGADHPVFKAIAAVVTAMNDAIPWPKELPLTETRKEDLKSQLKALSSAEATFLAVAHLEVTAS